MCALHARTSAVALEAGRAVDGTPSKIPRRGLLRRCSLLPHDLSQPKRRPAWAAPAVAVAAVLLLGGTVAYASSRPAEAPSRKRLEIVELFEAFETEPPPRPTREPATRAPRSTPGAGDTRHLARAPATPRVPSPSPSPSVRSSASPARVQPTASAAEHLRAPATGAATPGTGATAEAPPVKITARIPAKIEAQEALSSVPVPARTVQPETTASPRSPAPAQAARPPKRSSGPAPVGPAPAAAAVEAGPAAAKGSPAPSTETLAKTAKSETAAPAAQTSDASPAAKPDATAAATQAPAAAAAAAGATPAQAAPAPPSEVTLRFSLEEDPRLPERAGVYWASEAGALEYHYSDIAQGQTLEQRTSPGAIWRVRDTRTGHHLATAEAAPAPALQEVRVRPAEAVDVEFHRPDAAAAAGAEGVVQVFLRKAPGPAPSPGPAGAGPAAGPVTRVDGAARTTDVSGLRAGPADLLVGELTPGGRLRALGVAPGAAFFATDGAGRLLIEYTATHARAQHADVSERPGRVPVRLEVVLPEQVHRGSVHRLWESPAAWHWYADLAPGQALVLTTEAGERWRVRDAATGLVLGDHTAGEEAYQRLQVAAPGAGS